MKSSKNTTPLNALPQFACMSRYLYNDGTKYIIMYGTRASGKSYACAIMVINWLLNCKDAKILLVRTTYKDARLSCFEQIMSVIHKSNLERFFIIDKTNKRIVCPLTNSSTLLFGTGEVNDIKSVAEVTHAWIEEADQIEPTDFDIMDTTLRGTFFFNGRRGQSKVIMSLNPSNKSNWIYKRFIKDIITQADIPFNTPVLSADTRYVIHASSYKDNPYLNADNRESIHTLTYYNKTLGDRYSNAIWCDDSDEYIFKEELYKEYSTKPSLKGVIYCDLAGSTTDMADYTCIIKASTDKRNVYIEEISLGKWEVWNTMNEIAMLADHKHRAVGFDAHGMAGNFFASFFEKEYKKMHAKIELIPCKYSVAGLQDIASMMWMQGRILFPSGFSKTQLGKTFLEQTFSFISKKYQKHDDAPDAMVCIVALMIELNLLRK